MNEVLSQVSTWLKVNRVSLKISKTYFLKFNANCLKNKVVIDGYTITDVDWLKYLILHIDNRLNFQYHVSTVCNKISKW